LPFELIAITAFVSQVKWRLMNEQEKPERDAEVFVKGVKRRTRKKFSAEEKIRIVLEGMKRDVAVTELCRREGIPTAAYYSWTKDFMEGGKAQLQRDARRHTDASGVDALKKENAALRDLVADKEITIRIFKKTFGEDNT
jgi:transposase